MDHEFSLSALAGFFEPKTGFPGLLTKFKKFS